MTNRFGRIVSPALHVYHRAAELARTGRWPLTIGVRIIVRDEEARVLLVRPARGLLAGTWMLPAVETPDDEPVSRALATVGLRPRGAVRSRGEIRHVFTHRDVTARVVEVAASGEATGDVRWIAPEDWSSVALSSFARKALRLIADPL